MAKPRKTWQFVPAKPKPPQVPAVLKAELQTKAARLIEEDLSVFVNRKRVLPQFA